MARNRKDGTLVRDSRDPIAGIMPYIMRGRNESCVYYQKSFCVENIQRYIHDQRKKGNRITVFHIICTTLLHVFTRRPHLNRFVMGRHLYQHKNFDLRYVVKTKLTDEGLESIVRARLDGDDNIFSLRDQMTRHIEEIKSDGLQEDDKFIGLVLKLPRWVKRLGISILRILDFHGMVPQALVDLIPLYSSVFVSHMGSIGGDALFHHLYEVGNTSVFCVIGKIYLKPYRDIRTNGVIWKKTIDMNFTIDERICDGYYLIKSLEMFDTYINNPSLLERSPNEIIAEENRKKQEREQRIQENKEREKTKAKESGYSDLNEYWEDMLENPDAQNDANEDDVCDAE
ncbi:MAG: hypothetical protein GX910_06140 [Clostridiaceae bacterium]|nr:hypothetical protein [Clostridiaceae bacterium]